MLLFSIPLSGSTWNTDSNGNWTVNPNWCGAAPSGVDCVANLGNVISCDRTVTLNANRTVGTLNIDDNNNYTLACNTLTLDVSAGCAVIAVANCNGNGAHTVSSNISLNDNAAISNASTGTFTMSGVISGARSVTYSGDGSILLSGANTYSSGSTLAGANICVGHNSAFGTGSVTSSCDTIIQASGGARTLCNNIAMAAGSMFTVDGACNMTLNGVVSGGGIFKKCGAGTLRLNGNNTMADVSNSLTLEGNTWKHILLCYTVTANTILEYDFVSTNQGELHGIGFDNDNGISAGTTFKNHGTQNWGNTTYDTYPGCGTSHYTIPVGCHFTGCFDRVLFMMDHDALPRDGNMTISNIQIYESCVGPGGIIDFSAYCINSYGGAGQDSAPITVSTASTGVMLNAGTIELGNDNALGCATLEVNGGSITAVGGCRTITNDMEVNDSFTINDGQGLTWSGDISLRATNPTITVDNTSATDFSGVISGGGVACTASGFTKAGAQTLILSGACANTYSGITTVSAGTLQLSKTAGVNAVAGNITVGAAGTVELVNDNQIADTSNVTLGGGTLSMNGADETINGLTLTANSVIDLSGGNSILTMLGDINLNGFTLSIHNYNGSYSGGGSDQVIVNGAVNAGGGNIVFYGDGGVTAWGGGYIHGATANAQEVVPAPEASTWISMGGVLLSALFYRRLRKRSG